MTYPVQGHIHLSASLGSAPENAPMWYWKANAVDEKPNAILRVARTLRGKAQVHVLKSGTLPIIFRTYGFLLAVYDYGGLSAKDRLDILEAMLGRSVYFCPHRHPADGEDHTPAVVNMIVTQVGPYEIIDPLMNRYKVPILLESDNI